MAAIVSLPRSSPPKVLQSPAVQPPLPSALQLSRTASLPTPTAPPPPSPTKSALKKSLHSVTCRACAALNMSSSRYYPTSKRAPSPGAQKLSIPGRSSDSNFGSAYGGSYGSYPHEHRHSYTPTTSAPPRKTGGVIPISTEIVYKDNYPSSSSSGASAVRDAYSGRPRRSSDLTNTAPPLRTRPAIVQDSIPRPSSPLSRGYDARDGYVKSNTSVRRSEPKSHKLYSVDNSSAKLIAETEPYREPRRERGGYHLTGRSHRPRGEVDETSWSYTDPAGMYNDTEPIRRPRRGSVDGRRPTSVIEPYGSSAYARGSRDYGPPPTTRHVEKVNDMTRGASVREPARASSRDRQGSWDPYDMPLRSASTMPVVVNQAPEHRHSRDETYYRDPRDPYDDYRQPRHPTRQFTDDNVQSRGFGIRMPSVDGRHAGSNSSSAEPPVPRSVYPQQGVSYGGDALAKMPSSSEYAPPPPPPLDDRRDRRELPREREPEYVRDYDRAAPVDREYERERPREREVERERPKERERERPRERDYERDGHERHHHRRLSRDTSDTSSARDSVRDAAVPAAATAAGVAGIAAAGSALEKKRHEKKYDSEDDERNRRSRREPNDREDDRERRYAEKDREEKRRDERREDRKEDRKEEKPAIDPDEDYRRRIAQAQAELAGTGDGLTRQRSRDEERGDSDRERHRKREREDRERERRQSKDRDSRRGSDENAPPPRRERASSRARAPSIDARPRAPSVDAHAESQHNRLPDERHFTDRSYVQEPESVPGAYPPEPPQSNAGAMMPPPPPPGSVAPPPRQSTLPVPDLVQRSRSVGPSVSSNDRRVTIVEPPRNAPAEPVIKGILRKPTEKFPEHPDSVREGVTPLKDRLKKEGGGKDIPEGAKWTKIDRRLVNPQALEEKGERFEERQDFVIVLRVLTKDEIQGFANRTSEIREEREERYNREKKRHSTGGSRRHHHDDTDDSEDREYRHSRRHRDDDRDKDDGGDRERERDREHRDRDRGDRDRERERERDRERDREPRSSRGGSKKEYEENNSYESESEAAMRAIEDGRRRGAEGKRDLRDEYMSGGLAGR